MCVRAGIILPAICAALLLFTLTPSPADAASRPDSTAETASASALASNVKLHFDIAAAPLDKALREFAVQANRNVSYEPSIVAGLQGPAIKGEFTVADALSLLLKGTRLRAVDVDAHTIRILEKASSAAADTAESHDENDLTEIIVTGSHIRGESGASPVLEIGREEIDRSGYTSVADLMLSLPQNFGGGYNAGGIVNNSDVNSRYADNPTGASVPNLRGLGPGSTLTLIDGHRMAAGLPGGGADISSIPIDAIERIEVVTDSASAIYGSDAVAGVVNIILKKDYDGAKTSLSYGFAPDGGGTEKRASQLFGTHWDGGDVLFAFEHGQQAAVDARDRDFASSAPDPDSLLPQTRNNSATLSVTQALSGAVSVFADGLYIDRDSNIFLSGPGFPAPAESPASLSKYAATGGFNFNLWHDWKATLFVNLARDVTNSMSSFLTTPLATPRYDERFTGNMRNVEANANGAVASLPTGKALLAVGAGYREEAFSDAIGATSTSLVDSADGSRNIRYAFGELSIPLVQRSQRPGLNALDLTVSARSERYSDFGEKTVPKIGLVYIPTSSLKLRSTWGEAYRAPNLYDIGGVQQLVVIDLPNPSSPSGTSTVLARSGGNPGLQPETATEWSVGADFSAPDITALHVSTTFFDIRYTNRIASIADFYAALSDPLNAFFVTPSPSAASVQSVYDSYPSNQIFNATGSAFDPSKIAAIVDIRNVNVANETARGADFNVGYNIGTGSNSGLLFLNGTYLDLAQRDTPQSPEQTLSGLAFFPAKFRLRGGATWKWSSWALTTTLNYLPGETNNQVTPFQSVGSWTTVDASLQFAPALPGLLSRLHFSLSVLNAFDRDPPYLVTSIPGLNYDASNTSPLGRFVSLQISKEW
ncbi:MAG: TonB-dependent receptor [Steroidobacteraceae bacterium]